MALSAHPAAAWPLRRRPCRPPQCSLATFRRQRLLTTLYDPQPGGVGPYPCGRRASHLPFGIRMQLHPCLASVGSCHEDAGLSPAHRGDGRQHRAPRRSRVSWSTTTRRVGTIAYTRITNDAKITYNPTDKTNIFGRYSIEPYSLTDPQIFGNAAGTGGAGGAAVDGGQPGQASGRIQNVGLGVSHVITSSMVVDWDFGYTRQVTGAQSSHRSCVR